MAPLVPRMHLFEICDQSWFPSYFRRDIQAALLLTWHVCIPPGIPVCPADHCAFVLLRPDVAAGTTHTFVDFCAGAGGPTPRIERALNAAAARDGLPRADFVLTDLHPHIDAWEEAGKKSIDGKLRYLAESVDASAVDGSVMSKLVAGSAKGAASSAATAAAAEATSPAQLRRRGISEGPKPIFRLFNLAFHHFPDPLAKAILRNCVETSTPFAIFELQGRSIQAFLSVMMAGLGMLLFAPYFAYKWRRPSLLFWVYIVPVLPFVLVFDGFVSCLRTRTLQEVAVLLRESGAKGAEDWAVRGGREWFAWPLGYVEWIVGTPDGTREA